MKFSNAREMLLYDVPEIVTNRFRLIGVNSHIKWLFLNFGAPEDIRSISF
jgi:hypothetical protein